MLCVQHGRNHGGASSLVSGSPRAKRSTTAEGATDRGEQVWSEAASRWSRTGCEAGADQGERATIPEALVSKIRRRKAGGCARKDCILTRWHDAPTLRHQTCESGSVEQSLEREGSVRQAQCQASKNGTANDGEPSSSSRSVHHFLRLDRQCCVLQRHWMKIFFFRTGSSFIAPSNSLPTASSRSGSWAKAGSEAKP